MDLRSSTLPEVGEGRPHLIQCFFRENLSFLTDAACGTEFFKQLTC